MEDRQDAVVGRMGVGGDQSGMDKLIIERGLLINKITIADGYAPMLMVLIDTPSDLFKGEGCWCIPGFVKPELYWVYDEIDSSRWQLGTNSNATAGSMQMAIAGLEDSSCVSSSSLVQLPSILLLTGNSIRVGCNLPADFGLYGGRLLRTMGNPAVLHTIHTGELLARRKARRKD
ncbi:hypothetical protein KQX54_008038 [Cotesia glomerata]|uniref:Uncharacterized protein n=1 Tax=Cotesia glomerata TaxID=32391 RepID=A0AAV7IQZ3_COTGL|nr:hypothetical protein KQX54_008038 [Cotesia glomerata]